MKITDLNDYVTQLLDQYGIIIAAFVVGFIIAWQLKFWMSDRVYRKQVNLRIGEKDKLIQRYEILISEEIRKEITKEKVNMKFVNRLRKMFRGRST